MKTVTFSRNVFLPITNVCRNKCAYCGFRRRSSDPDASLMTESDVLKILDAGKAAGCTEALFTFGEYADEDPDFGRRLEKIGFSSMVDYVRHLSETAVRAGLLPHTNAGLLSFEELRTLAPYNAGMGLMLETTAPAPRIRAHIGSPGKVPERRIEVIENAGKLKIPFTTGLLIGIGETSADREESLDAIAALHRKYGHIQEVIIQNFTPKDNLSPEMRIAGPTAADMKAVIEAAVRILPPDVPIQVAPNLIDPIDLLRIGVSDLGGISPLTVDHINPEAAWPNIDALKKRLSENGFLLRERLPIHPVYVKAGLFGEKTAALVRELSDAEGFRKIE